MSLKWRNNEYVAFFTYGLIQLRIFHYTSD
nr:MAG TPA: hypothetical protein [Caudoviricetes sp.]